MSSFPSSSTHKLTDAKALVFDVYGTLVDWDSGIYDALAPLVPSSWSRRDALTAFNAIEVDLQARFPRMLYSDLLARAHQEFGERIAAQSKGVVSSPLETTGAAIAPEEPKPGESSSAPHEEAQRDLSVHEEFGRSIKDWPLFPDTVAALRTLAKHFTLVVLSNVDNASFANTHYKLAGGTEAPSSDAARDAYIKEHSPFTLVLTAQDVGAYKPSTIGFEAVLARLKERDPSITREQVYSTAASLLHDHGPANALGLGSVWIRRKGEAQGLGDRPEGMRIGWTFATLGEMADAVEKEAARGSSS